MLDHIQPVALAAVSSREYLTWQCQGDAGIALDRLGEVCGCFSHEQENYACHHPASPCGMCAGNECPIAYIDFPEGSSEEECIAYSELHGDEMEMTLARDDDQLKAKNFGQGGAAKSFWIREQRLPDLLASPQPRAPADTAIQDPT